MASLKTPRLNEQLRLQRLGQIAEVKTAYEAMVGELARRGFIDQVLAVGDRFPDMALPTAEGELTRLADWWRRGRSGSEAARWPTARIGGGAGRWSSPFFAANGAPIVG
jgi:hypothetical protein